jgi:hypothetical protein
MPQFSCDFPQNSQALHLLNGAFNCFPAMILRHAILVILIPGRHVGMQNLFDATVANQIKIRLGNLELHSERHWGKMTPAQMLAHCSLGVQWAVGEVVPEKGALPARLIGRLVKPLVFRNEDPLKKNSPTAKSLIVADDRDLGKERERLSGLIDKFTAAGAAGCTKNPHSFFGKLTPEEWAMLMYKHLDHHLRQFGV